MQTDIVYHHWLFKIMPKCFHPFMLIARYDRPIGTWLVGLPCLWGLALAVHGVPPLKESLLFLCGAFLMRGAGCTLNDLADEKMDAKVERTKGRPLPAKLITRKQAFAFMLLQMGLGLLILLQFNALTIQVALSSLGLVIVYPFMKRYTYWPQAVLGLAFNWGVFVGWFAINSEPRFSMWLMYGVGFLMTLCYDTIYAHQDKEDDISVGVKSTALKFAEKTKAILSVFYGLIFAGIVGIGILESLNIYYYLITAGTILWALIVLVKTDLNQPQQCLQAFKDHKWFYVLYLLALTVGFL